MSDQSGIRRTGHSLRLEMDQASSRYKLSLLPNKPRGRSHQQFPSLRANPRISTDAEHSQCINWHSCHIERLMETFPKSYGTEPRTACRRTRCLWITRPYSMYGCDVYVHIQAELKVIDVSVAEEIPYPGISPNNAPSSSSNSFQFYTTPLPIGEHS